MSSMSIGDEFFDLVIVMDDGVSNSVGQQNVDELESSEKKTWFSVSDTYCYYGNGFIHTCDEWKKAWTYYKAKQKIKLKAIEEPLEKPLEEPLETVTVRS